MDDRSQFSRDRQLDHLTSESGVWDLVVIGGGATGVGIAIDAATRNYRVALVEQYDFGKGTSSRSTKLAHGGVRYLEQGNVSLVREALHERGRMIRNAPHLVHPLPTIVPLHSHWERFYYGVGLKVYDLLSGRLRLGPSRYLTLSETTAEIPTLQTHGIVGGIRYYDGAFDDARLLINMMQTAIEAGATCVNYVRARELMKESGRVVGVVAEDGETGREIRLRAKVVVNATGPFSDHVRRMDEPQAPAAIVPSQGIHLVFDRAFMPGDSALIVPKTRDGRVIFAIPWHEHTMVGTTDTELKDAPVDPRPLPEEISFLLETIAPYWTRKPQASDIRAIFAGIRPLARSDDSKTSSKLARDHVIRVSSSGLVSIMGGKWTTYRRMAEDGVDRAAAVGGLLPTPCRTKTLPIHGGQGELTSGALAQYGSDGPAIAGLAASQPGLDQPLADRLPHTAAQVVWAARHEMARSVEDVLARRVRALFYDAEAAIAAAPLVASLLAEELGRDAKWQADQLAAFHSIAELYRYHR
ncbi:MAG: FAD-dependent oxidoreductase [Pirellulales bacterium]